MLFPFDPEQNLNCNNLVIKNKIRYGSHFEKACTYKYLPRLIDCYQVGQQSRGWLIEIMF